MLSLMKAQLAEFSYFLEKYFGLTSIIWSILFMSFCYALFFALVTKIIEYIIHKKRKKSITFIIYVRYLQLYLDT